MRRIEPGPLVVATHNKGKAAEIRDLLGPYGFDLRFAADLGLREPAEDGDSFEANAFTKAFSAAQSTGLPALSDDSGLCVEALNGEPGVYTADWAELPQGGRDFSVAMQKVEDRLAAIDATTDDARRAKFVAVLCLAWPDGHAEYFRGEVEGTLVWPPRGQQGFGYDPMFRPEGFEQTFGEMPASQKHGWEAGRGDLGLSHRARAFAALAQAVLS